MVVYLRINELYVCGVERDGSWDDFLFLNRRYFIVRFFVDGIFILDIMIFFYDLYWFGLMNEDKVCFFDYGKNNKC